MEKQLRIIFRNKSNATLIAKMVLILGNSFTWKIQGQVIKRFTVQVHQAIRSTSTNIVFNNEKRIFWLYILFYHLLDFKEFKNMSVDVLRQIDIYATIK